MEDQIIDLDAILRSKIFWIIAFISLGFFFGYVSKSEPKQEIDKMSFSNELFEELINLHEIDVGSYKLNENMTLKDIRNIYVANKEHPSKRMLIYEMYRRVCSG